MVVQFSLIDECSFLVVIIEYFDEWSLLSVLVIDCNWLLWWMDIAE